jgi:hypothetical protein
MLMKIDLLLCYLFLVVTSSFEASGAVLELRTAKDAHITDSPNFITQNLSDGGLIRNWSNNARSIGLIEFDLDALPTNPKIISASFSLFQSNPGNAGSVYDIFQVTSSWSESTVTFATAPSIAPQAVSSTVIPTNAGGFCTWDITTLVQGWLSGMPNFGMWIEEVPIAGAATGWFHGTESRDEAIRPFLTINYVPEGSTFGMLLVSIITLISCSRKASA